MATMTNTVKVKKYFEALTFETNNFAFEAKVILGLVLAQMAWGLKKG